MRDIHVYFIFFSLAPSIYWASNRDFISYYAEYVEFCFFTKISKIPKSRELGESKECCIPSGEETYNILQGDDSSFYNFWLNFYSGNEVIFWVLVELWM